MGCFQYLNGTWKLYSKEVLGYVARRSEVNEEYVATHKVQRLLNAGYTAYEIGLIWNGGEPVEKKGVNKYGEKYDTGLYAKNLVAQL